MPQDFTLRLINASSPPVIRYSTWRPGAPADRLLDDQFVMNNAILASVGVGKRIVMESKTADQVCIACMRPASNPCGASTTPQIHPLCLLSLCLSVLRCSAARCRRVTVTYEQWTGRFPRFWDASAYRATPPSLGTYGWRYPARYRVRERPLTGGAANATEWLVQVLLLLLPAGRFRPSLSSSV